MQNCRVGMALMLAFVAGCSSSPPVSSRRIVVLAETHDATELVALRDVIIQRERMLHGQVIAVARGTELVAAFVDARPRRLEPWFVREVLGMQRDLDRDLARYQALGGRLWCERPIVESRHHQVSIETLEFVGLPRYRDVARDTYCFLEDSGYPGGRRPIMPLLNLDYRLGAGNDLIGDEYTMERYPIAPLPPVPVPVPLPLVCDGAFCHVIEPQIH